MRLDGFDHDARRARSEIGHANQLDPDRIATEVETGGLQHELAAVELRGLQDGRAVQENHGAGRDAT